MCIYIYMCAFPLFFIKERNKVSTASAYCLEQRRARLIVDGISVKTDKTVKESRGREREWRNHKESQRRWCRASTCQTTATYGKPQSPYERYTYRPTTLQKRSVNYTYPYSMMVIPNSVHTLGMNILVYEVHTKKVWSSSKLVVIPLVWTS